MAGLIDDWEIVPLPVPETIEEYLIRKELDDAVTRQQDAMTRQVQPVGFWQNIANQAANFMGWR